MSRPIDNDGIVVVEVPTCPLCGEAGAAIYRAQRDRLFGARGVWNLRRCPSCRTFWLDPRPLEGEIGKLYEDYFTHREGTESRQRLDALRRRIAKRVLPLTMGYDGNGSGRALGRVLSWVPPLREMAAGTVLWLPARPARLLDVGSGSGEFIGWMQEMGWEAVGVEPDPQAASFARRHFGVSVIDGTLFDANIPDQSFDAVTLSHVIEHVTDPVALLRECKRVLKRSGYLVVATPNADSLARRVFRKDWRGLEIPRHLFVFSRRALRDVASRAGLRVLSLRTSTRAATFMSMTSMTLRRRDALPGGGPERWAGVPLAGGLAFQAIEGLLTSAGAHLGEELVLVATSPAS